jgi:uncharacterized protein DUF4395
LNQPAARPTMVDTRQPRLGQAVTGATLLVGFVLDVPPILPIVGLLLGAAALLGPRFNPYAWLFRALRRTGVLGPARELEEAAPPRFANAVGFVCLAGATAAAYLGASWVGWALALLVAALALLSAVTGLCVGCEVYVLARRVATRGRAPGHVVRQEASG